MNEKKEYIDREAALEIVKRTSGYYAIAFYEIRQLSVADVAPVVHGEWISTTKHKWKTKDNGEVDEFAWDGDIHNGPVCEICGFHPCVHCKPDWETDENCRGHFVCSVCGRHEKEKYPYCHCGAKMDGGGKNG